MSTTIYQAPPGMVMMAEGDAEELQRLRALAAGGSHWINDRMPKYGKWVLVKHGKNGRVYIARRVKRTEYRNSSGKLIGIAAFETREKTHLLGINLWTEFPT